MRRLGPRLYTVRGNHDKVVAGIDNGANFNQTALTAAQWTTGRLTPANLRYVRDLPQGPLRDRATGLAICHGSPLDEDTYVFSDVDAYEIFSALLHAGGLLRPHAHPVALLAGGAAPRGDGAARRRRARSMLDPEGRYLINPGSIGQPRDRDPRASYMTYDSRRRVVRWHRIPYPIAEAQQRIRGPGCRGRWRTGWRWGVGPDRTAGRSRTRHPSGVLAVLLLGHLHASRTRTSRRRLTVDQARRPARRRGRTRRA